MPYRKFDVEGDLSTFLTVVAHDPSPQITSSVLVDSDGGRGAHWSASCPALSYIPVEEITVKELASRHHDRQWASCRRCVEYATELGDLGEYDQATLTWLQHAERVLREVEPGFETARDYLRARSTLLNYDTLAPAPDMMARAAKMVRGKLLLALADRKVQDAFREEIVLSELVCLVQLWASRRDTDRDSFAELGLTERDIETANLLDDWYVYPPLPVPCPLSQNELNTWALHLTRHKSWVLTHVGSVPSDFWAAAADQVFPQPGEGTLLRVPTIFLDGHDSYRNRVLGPDTGQEPADLWNEVLTRRTANRATRAARQATSR